MIPTYTDTAYKSFDEETLHDLKDKEGYAVLPGAAEGTVKLPANAAEAAQCIGVIYKRTRPDDKEVNVRLFGKGGTLKARMGGIVAKVAAVKVAAGGKLVAAASGDLAVGRRLDQGNSADNDFSEILDGFFTTP